MTGPLEGLLVVSLKQAVAAPFCTARLADAGARVIKVERPEGDFARFYDNATPAGSSYFVWLNRGKESVVLDMQAEKSRVALEAIIAKADVVVQNFKPGALDRLGFSVARLRSEYPSLIVCSITGYGDSGPFKDRKAYDLLIQAETGLASITGTADSPARVGISVVDIATGATAHSAVLEALIARSRTGKGADIRVSLFDVMADWMAVPFLNAAAGAPPERVGLSHPSIAPYGVFTTSCGEQLLISIQSEREWQSFCDGVLQDGEAANDPRFSTNVSRVANRQATDQLVASRFHNHGVDELVERLTAGDIAFARLNNVEALQKHPHLRKIQIDTASGSIELPAPGAIWTEKPREYGSVPTIGQHTETILAEFVSTH